MDRKTQQVGSSASFTSELFDSKESSASPGIFGTIFAPSSKVVGMVGRRQDPANETWNTKHETHDGTSKSNEGESPSTASRDVNSIYQEQRVQQPCHLSSSIYYGGQDIYNHPQNSPGSTMNSMFKKDATEDDTGSASRGNWWQGMVSFLLLSLWIRHYRHVFVA
ncbi:hypothetical protein K2173_019650 [Erythroxylum novogranatense]|uniref:Uncharacterized protein n=1 Tax=Erythroxylum novogranatense TaxID=1862640 RepID=A0AAV8UBZ0_9ROSI|nr:hypothetical protein K2173_019650 [Erythroxylum novogranatense]